MVFLILIHSPAKLSEAKQECKAVAWYEVEVGTFVIALELLISSICVCTN